MARWKLAALFFFFSSRRRHTRSLCDWSSDVCSSDLGPTQGAGRAPRPHARRHHTHDLGNPKRRGRHAVTQTTPAARTGPGGQPVNDRREIFGWMLYDWANSAFYTTVVGALLGPYLIALAQADVGKTGVVLSLGPLGAVTAQSFSQVFVAVAVGSQ